jgi:hypothetical protein
VRRPAPLDTRYAAGHTIRLSRSGPQYSGHDLTLTLLIGRHCSFLNFLASLKGPGCRGNFHGYVVMVVLKLLSCSLVRPMLRSSCEGYVLRGLCRIVRVLACYSCTATYKTHSSASHYFERTLVRYVLGCTFLSW